MIAKLDAQELTQKKDRLKREAFVTVLVEHLQEEGATPIQILLFLTMNHKPSAAFTYAVRIQALPRFQHFKQDREWSQYLENDMRLEKSRQQKKQAPEILAEEMLKVLSANTPASHVIGFLWISISRLGDLPKIEILKKLEIEANPESTPLTLLALSYKGTKPDVGGERGDTKAVFVPTGWIATLEKQFLQETEKQPVVRKAKEALAEMQNKSPQSSELYSAQVPKAKKHIKQTRLSRYFIMKALAPVKEERPFTAHSMRRGATTTLVPHFPLSHIGKLSLHNQKDHQQMVATYASNIFFKEERELLQMTMSLLLLKNLGLVSLSMIAKLSQEYKLSIPSESRATDVWDQTESDEDAENPEEL